MDDTTGFPQASLSQEIETRKKKTVYMSMGNNRRGGRRTKKTAAIQNRTKRGPAPPLELGDGDLSAYSVAAERGFL
jgi:hypothetical protein